MQFASPLSLINTGIVSRAFFHRRVLPGPVRINQRDCQECLLVIHFFNQIKQLCPIYRLLKHWIKWRVRAGGRGHRERELLTVSVNKNVLTHSLTDRPQWVSWYRVRNRKTCMIALYWPSFLFSLLKTVLMVSWNRVAFGNKLLLKLCYLLKVAHATHVGACIFWLSDVVIVEWLYIITKTLVI